jgi:hypothetical protein
MVTALNPLSKTYQGTQRVESYPHQARTPTLPLLAKDMVHFQGLVVPAEDVTKMRDLINNRRDGNGFVSRFDGRLFLWQQVAERKLLLSLVDSNNKKTSHMIHSWENMNPAKIETNHDSADGLSEEQFREWIKKLFKEYDSETMKIQFTYDDWPGALETIRHL